MGLHFIKGDITSSQNLASGALSYTTSIGRKFKVEEITIHASVAITETITITRDSAQGANYDTVLRTWSMVSQQDFVWRPEGECSFQAGDELKVQCTNANVTGTVYLTIKTSELP